MAGRQRDPQLLRLFHDTLPIEGKRSVEPRQADDACFILCNKIQRFLEELLCLEKRSSSEKFRAIHGRYKDTNSHRGARNNFTKHRLQRAKKLPLFLGGQMTGPGE